MNTEKYVTYDPKPKESIYQHIIDNNEYFQEKLRKINRKVEIIEEIEKDSVIDLGEVDSFSQNETAYSENLSARQSSRGYEKFPLSFDEISERRMSGSGSTLNF